MTTRIGLTGDVMLGRLVDERQRTRPVTAVWGDMHEELRDLDGLLINLECCLSTRGTPWTRTHRPFHFRADPDWAVPALTAATVDACALANNHLMDFGEEALLDTVSHLREAEIASAGAGNDRAEAFEPAFLSIGDLEVALISLTDNTPEYAATPNTPGTAHVEIDVDNEETRDAITRSLSLAREQSPDLVIASLHWGPNMVERPPDSFRDFGRWLVDRGIDVVHGHSAHVFQGIEVHDGCPILYDTGDFVDDYAVDPRLRNDRSFLFVLTVSGTGTPRKLRLIPTEIADRAVHRANPESADWSRERMIDRSEELGTTVRRDGDQLVVVLDA